MSSTWIVHKFGGTRLADAARYQSVGRILLAPGRRPGARATAAVVFSDLLRLASYSGAPQ